MQTYKEKNFMLPPLDGLSPKSIEEHLGLYAGYVKNFNAQSALIEEYLKDSQKHAHAIAEIMRRRSFEFGGMRLHEHYFAQFEDGKKDPDESGALCQALSRQFGSTANAITQVEQTGMMRGPGWSILYYDKEADNFLIGFSGEQHQGHFATLPIILALDVWEHAYLLDYGAQGKAKYVEAFFKNLNWQVLEQRFADIRK